MQLLIAPVLAALALLSSTAELDAPLHAPSADVASAAVSSLGPPPNVLDPCAFGRLQLASLEADIEGSKDAAAAAAKAWASAQAAHQEQPSEATRAAMLAAEKDLKGEMRTLDSLTLAKLQLLNFLEAFCEESLE